jgi:type IV secretion system protein VirB10
MAAPTSPLSALGQAEHRNGDGGAPAAGDGYLNQAYQSARSAYELKAGDIITGALLTALDSDLPGSVVAQVTRDVFDHATGEHLLVPQGARLFGHYDSKVAYGQTRAFVVWTRIIMPDGRSVNIGSMTGGDLTGASGLRDSVDSHIGPITRAIALSTALVVGGAVSQDVSARSSGGLVLNDAANGASAQAAQAGQRFVDRDLNRQPTIHVRPGWPISLVVSEDISLDAY